MSDSRSRRYGGDARRRYYHSRSPSRSRTPSRSRYSHRRRRDNHHRSSHHRRRSHSRSRSWSRRKTQINQRRTSFDRDKRDHYHHRYRSGSKSSKISDIKQETKIKQEEKLKVEERSHRKKSRAKGKRRYDNSSSRSRSRSRSRSHSKSRKKSKRNNRDRDKRNNKNMNRPQSTKQYSTSSPYAFERKIARKKNQITTAEWYRSNLHKLEPIKPTFHSIATSVVCSRDKNKKTVITKFELKANDDKNNNNGECKRNINKNRRSQSISRNRSYNHNTKWNINCNQKSCIKYEPIIVPLGMAPIPLMPPLEHPNPSNSNNSLQHQTQNKNESNSVNIKDGKTEPEKKKIIQRIHDELFSFITTPITEYSKKEKLDEWTDSITNIIAQFVVGGEQIHFEYDSDWAQYDHSKEMFLVNRSSTTKANYLSARATQYPQFVIFQTITKNNGHLMVTAGDTVFVVHQIGNEWETQINVGGVQKSETVNHKTGIVGIIISRAKTLIFVGEKIVKCGENVQNIQINITWDVTIKIMQNMKLEWTNT